VHKHSKVPEHLEHLAAINDVRVALESSGTRIRFFYAHWELSALGWMYPVIPDAAFSVISEETSTCMVEIDRGTELNKDILKKFEGYAIVALTFPFDAVILLTTSPKGRSKSERLWATTERPFGIFLGTRAEMLKEGIWSMQLRLIGKGMPSGSEFEAERQGMRIRSVSALWLSNHTGTSFQAAVYPRPGSLDHVPKISDQCWNGGSCPGNPGDVLDSTGDFGGSLDELKVRIGNRASVMGATVYSPTKI